MEEVSRIVGGNPRGGSLVIVVNGEGLKVLGVDTEELSRPFLYFILRVDLFLVPGGVRISVLGNK